MQYEQAYSFLMEKLENELTILNQKIEA